MTDMENTNQIYDRNKNQQVPLSIQKGNVVFDVAIEFSPLSDERYLAFADSYPNFAKKIKTLTFDLYSPLAELGRELAVARHGYKERSDWREKTRDSDYINAMKGLLTVRVADNTENAETLLDDDEETYIELISNFNGEEKKTKVWFREETKTEMDEFLAAVGDEPRKGVLASAKKISKERRLFELFQAISTKTENYENDDIPAWHAIEAISGFMNLQIIRMGKF